MKAYLALARTSARSILAYRLNFLLAQFALLFQLLAMLSIWRVLLESGRHVGGFTWPQMKVYLLIAFGTGALLSANGDMRMGWRIREGMVAVDLTKPVDYQRARLAECLGGVVLEIAMTLVVVFAVVALTGGLPAPGLGQAGFFVLSLLIVVPVKFCVLYITSLMCFWTQNFLGLYLTRMAVVNLFSGALVPLAFLPGALQAVAAVLPFASITSTPALIYLGRASGSQALGLLAVQAVWVLVLWFGARLLWKAAARQLTVHGG